VISNVVAFTPAGREEKEKTSGAPSAEGKRTFSIR